MISIDGVVPVVPIPFHEDESIDFLISQMLRVMEREGIAPVVEAVK